jgi:hypothetical protein
VASGGIYLAKVARATWTDTVLIASFRPAEEFTAVSDGTTAGARAMVLAVGMAEEGTFAGILDKFIFTCLSYHS